MRHYIRDALCDHATAAADRSGCINIALYVIYHWLRVMGWDQIWECDGTTQTPNRCPDADMELAGVTNWTIINGATRAKTTSQKHMGEQGLQVTVASAGDGIESASFSPAFDSGEEISLDIWAYNPLGTTLSIDVHDGTTWQTGVGTISASMGSWQKFTTTVVSATATGGNFRIVTSGAAAGDFYIDSVIVRRSFFENNNATQTYTDGEILNGNEFRSSSYSFTAGDVDKFVVCKGALSGNSGAYRVTGASGGTATLDIRVGASETLSSETSLSFRVIDPDTAPGTAAADADEAGAGFGLESPHSQGWRVFFRQALTSGSNNNKDYVSWSAPTQTDFSVISGHFLLSGPSTDLRSDSYDYGNMASDETRHIFRNGTYSATDTYKRLFVHTDDDGTFISVAMRSQNNYHAYFSIGFTGLDPSHAENETFVHLMPRFSSGNVSSMVWGSVSTSWGHVGTSFDLVNNRAIRCSYVLWGHLTLAVEWIDQTHADVNDFSSEEVLERLGIVQDPASEFGGAFDVWECTNGMMFHCRNQAVTWSTSSFDSNLYIHFEEGIAWPWDTGVTVAA